MIKINVAINILSSWKSSGKKLSLAVKNAAKKKIIFGVIFIPFSPGREKNSIRFWRLMQAFVIDNDRRLSWNERS